MFLLRLCLPLLEAFSKVSLIGLCLWLTEDLGATESVESHLDFQENMVAFLLGEIMLLCISLNC